METPKNRSKFTYRHLAQLSKYSVESPLRVIALVDLDAFYAQCEMKRLNVAPEKPLAVQQWQNLIAVNYSAREKGVTRHITAVEAKKLCPDIQLVHVAIWRAGEAHWAYTENPDWTVSKACLDPYRAESKKILDVFHDVCPNTRIERASIDESYLDLSKVVHDRLVDRFPEIKFPPPHDHSEFLPLPNVKKLDWAGSHLVANADEGGRAEAKTEIPDLDWDDVAMAFGAEIVKSLRSEVFKRLGYTCSAGVANNKIIAKLGSGYKKPNQQSVIRTSTIQHFLNTFQFTKIRSLGGKLGKQISAQFHTDSIPTLLSVSLAQLQSMLPDDTATWVYNVIRGVEKGAVSPRSTIKSMLSAKSFREPHLPSCFAEGQAWLKVFVADIASRINDDEVCRRPKNMTISFTNKASGSRNRQTAIPSGIGQVGAAVLLKTAEELLKRVAEGAWPCERLSMLVGGFEEKEEGNRGIGDFLVKRPPPVSQLSIPTLTPQTPQIDPNTSPNNNTISQDQNLNKRKFPLCHDTDKAQTSVCTECDSQIPIWKAEQHKDWHFAKNLAKQDRLSALPPPPQSQPSLALRKSGRPPGGGGSSSRKKGRKEAQSGGGRLEKGQRTLNF